MKNFDKEENQETELSKQKTAKKEQTYKVQSPFTYDRKYYPGQDIELNDAEVIKDLTNKKMIK